MRKVVFKKLVLFLTGLVLLAVLGVFVRESSIRQQAIEAYESQDTLMFRESIEALWFTSDEDKGTILFRAKAFAWYGEFKID